MLLHSSCCQHAGKGNDPLIPFNAEGTDSGTNANDDSKPKGPAEAHDYEADWVEEGTPASENSGSTDIDPNPRKVPVRPPVAETDPESENVPVRLPDEITDVPQDLSSVMMQGGFR